MISNNETFRNYLISLPAYSLIMWLMRSPKNFEKRANLKISQLISIWWSKNHFGKTPLKWCIFRHEKSPLPIWLSNSLCSYKTYMIFWSFVGTIKYLNDNFWFKESIFKWQIKLFSCRSKFWHLRRKSVLTFSKLLFFQNSLVILWATWLGNMQMKEWNTFWMLYN